MLETDEELAATFADLGRADVAVSAAFEATGAGLTVTAGISSVDQASVERATLTIVLGSGVRLLTVPAECANIASDTFECDLGLIEQGTVPTIPVEIELDVVVDAAATDPAVTVTATSLDNPIDNDPDPTNNTTTVELPAT